MNQIIWRNGLFLQPEHFQYWDMCRTAELNDRLNTASESNWGVKKVALNLTAFAVGDIEFTELEVILRDGTVIKYPENCYLNPLNIYEKAKHGDKIEIFLDLPIRKPGRKNLAVLGESEAGDIAHYRYIDDGSVKKVYDEYENEKYTDISCLKYNISLSTDGTEERFTYTTRIKLMEVNYLFGSYTKVPDYIPPCLNFEGCDGIKKRMLAILKKLSVFINADKIRADKNKLPNSQALTREDMTIILCTRAKYQLHGFINNPCHPKIIWDWIYAFCIEFSAFNGLKFTPIDVIYQHSDLRSSFKQIVDCLMNYLSVQWVVPQKLANLNFDGTYFVSSLNSSWVYEKTLVLGLQFQNSQSVDCHLDNIKIGSRQTLPLILSGSLAGLSFSGSS